MAKFISLTEHTSGRSISVNIDFVVHIRVGPDDEYTIVELASSSNSTFAVAETIVEIQEALGSQKSGI